MAEAIYHARQDQNTQDPNEPDYYRSDGLDVHDRSLRLRQNTRAQSFKVSNAGIEGAGET
jgi:hypothetical protein